MRFFIMSDSRRSLFPTSLERVPVELLITYRFLTGSDVSRIKIVSQTMLFIEKSDFHRSLSPTSVGESFYETPSYISFSYRKRRAWKVTIPFVNL